MAVELARWEVMGVGGERGEERRAVRVSLSARQLAGLERLALHLEALLEEDGLPGSRA
jgi:hypothetical protein